MKRPPAPINPFMPDLQERLDYCLPDGHPAKESRMLSPLQEQALPTLLWFFDQMRARGTGKSYLMAVTIIELAKRGYRVGIFDASQTMTNPSFEQTLRSNRYLRSLILQITKEHYPLDMFEMIRKQGHEEYELIYRGQRPR